jgi:hypothetical protein
VPNQGVMVGGGKSHFVFRQKLLGENGTVRRRVVMVKHKLGCDTVHAQFFLQNPLACPTTNSHLLSNVLNCPTSFLTEER